MGFTALPRARNFWLKYLKAYLSLYPEIENDLEWRIIGRDITWSDAKNELETKLNRYSQTYYQQAAVWGLENRGNDNMFDFRRELLMFNDDQLKKYCQFWFKIFYAPNPYTQEKSEKPLLLYCFFARKLLESATKMINFNEVLAEAHEDGQSKDILFNCFVDWGEPIKCKKTSVDDWYLYIEDNDVELLEQLINRIEEDFTVDINRAFDKTYYYERYSYKNYAKYWQFKMHDIEINLEKELHKLPQAATECAKVIVDYIYRIDEFERINSLLTTWNEEKEIKVDITRSTFHLDYSLWPRYLFALQLHEYFDTTKDPNGKTRLFDTEYIINIGGKKLKGKLTNQWDSEVEPPDPRGHNSIQALVNLVNQYYSDFLEIKKEEGRYYLYPLNFSFKDVRESLSTDFSRRFITSLLAKPFVILTGNSGTGKTRIAKQFAEYLEVKNDNEEKNWLIVPVGADWTDNTKILGFYNPLTKKYEETSILKLIERANNNKKVPYFIILDEMNLSHVERYFSDFLSHMETPDSSFKLDGYNNGKEFDYPKNLFIVGTVNIDETTYMFSPKVLDRANVVEFKPKKEEVMDLFDKPTAEGKVRPASDGTAKAFLRLAQEIRDGRYVIKTGYAEMMFKASIVFDKVYDAVKDQGFEFAYRTVREIRQYILAAYEISDDKEKFNLDQAIDEQILQKVLPKIHGNRKEIGKLLEDLEKICLDKSGNIRFKLSTEKIKQMKGKLDSVQYASFI